MTTLAIIGGTGLTSLETLTITRREMVQTPYGEPSGPLTHGELYGTSVVFLPRHGRAHTIPPHRVNYRANLWALRHIGVRYVLAVAAVGGIREDMAPGVLAVPDQVIDYTYGRAHTFFDGDDQPVTHVDFTSPYCDVLRRALIDAGGKAGVDPIADGTYGATQGPRLETAMEIRRMARDGCDLVGMTGMPEAVLARELGLCYAACAVVANRAAGLGTETISMDAIEANLKDGMERVRALLHEVAQIDLDHTH
ncbi:MAG: S-methyl-5'-thioinosine phosphorylase [Gammaproteobacteria bacterium]|nr:S-methyl-5'-thioinosine phosphorylase [Gammaproteobacteria bacterium]